MKIINAMLGQGQGGIEQALVDYQDALSLAGHEVHALIHPDAAVKPVLQQRKIPFHTLANFGKWDPFAMLKLRRILHDIGPDASIGHGNRALSLLKCAGAKKLVVPLHNYKIKCANAAGVFSPTRDLATYAQEQGLPENRIYLIPNMVRVPTVPAERRPHSPPVIGSMGRFVAKKGFDVFINALALLKSKGVVFRAVLAGDGEEAAALRKQAADKGLAQELTFAGWVNDKQAFFDGIDVFCLPSHHEPFGIVLLEAMAQKLPVVATASEGPSEIIENGVSGAIVPLGDAEALAIVLAGMLKMPERAAALGEKAYETVKGGYDLPVISAKLDFALKAIVKRALPP